MTPRPSANHFGSVNVLMADGRTIALNERIDPRVYYRALTSNGRRYGEEPIEDCGF